MPPIFSGHIDRLIEPYECGIAHGRKRAASGGRRNLVAHLRVVPGVAVPLEPCLTAFPAPAGPTHACPTTVPLARLKTPTPAPVVRCRPPGDRSDGRLR